MLDQLLRQPRLRRGVALGAWFTLQALTSVHLFVFSGFALVVATLVRAEAWSGINRRQVLGALAAALAASGLVLVPLLLPYWRVSQAQHFTRSLEVVAGHAAVWQDYLSTPARLHYTLWSHRFFTGSALFPGALALSLAGVAIVRGVAWSNPRARMCLAIAAAGVALSFGPTLPGYSVLYALLPPLQAIRGVVRFGYLGIVGASALAGFGVVALRHWIPARRWPGVAVALVAVAAFESCAAPLGLTPFTGVPAIYSAVATEPRALVVEIPFYDGQGAAFHAPYMLNSTAHWQPILNGYSGFQPASFNQHAADLGGFPDARAIDALSAAGVSYVFVHANRMTPAQLEVLRRHPRLTLVQAQGSIELYRLASDRAVVR